MSGHHPPVLPDTNDTGVQCCVDTDEYSAFLTKQFDNVAILERAFNEARREASNTLDVLCEQLEKSQALEHANEQLKQRLSTLTTENESLLKRTFELTDELATLRKLATSHRHTPVLQRMVAHHVTRLPLHSEAEDAPDNLLFDLLGCTPTAYTSGSCCIPRTQTKAMLFLQLPASTYHWSRKPNEFSRIRTWSRLIFVVACPVLDDAIWVCERAVIVTPSFKL